MSDRILRLYIRVVDGRTAFPCFAAAQSDRDVIVSLLLVKRPGAGRAHIPSTGKVENAKRLGRQRLHSRAAILPGKRVLPLDQRAQQPFLGRTDRDCRKTGLPLTRPQAWVGSARHRDQRSNANLDALLREQKDIEKVDIAQSGVVSAAGIGTRTDRQGRAEDLRHANQSVGPDGKSRGEQHIISMRTGTDYTGVVAIFSI